ncbi:MAG TPA: pilin [Xanthomonadaceae bacterium]|nr:pilin [Xanthomonadaceae bacterium]
MNQFRRLLLASSLAAITLLTGCNRPNGHASSENRPPAVDAAAIARADALISQPAWLRERLPEHTVAYARIPSLWGALSAPDGRPLDAALATDQHAKIIASLRKAAQSDPTLAQAGAGPVLQLLLGDQSGPIEVAVIDASDGVSPFSRALVTTALDVPDVATLDARIASLSAGGQSPLQAPLDANGDASLQKFGALHFDAQTHRLYLSVGTTASAMTLEQDLAQIKATRTHPMQEDEREIDQSGQGLFVWMSMKGLNAQLEAQLQDQPPDGLLRDAVEHMQSVALGWGTVDGHGRLQLQVRAPQARLLGYLGANVGDIGIKTSGTPDWAATMAMPGHDNLQQIRDNLDRDFGPGVRTKYDDLMAKLQTQIGYDPLSFEGLFGKQMVMFADSNGSFVALQVRDSKTLYAKLDELSRRFGWRNTVVKVGGGEIHHLHVTMPEPPANAANADPQVTAWSKLYLRAGADYYWIDEGSYLVSAKVPQPLIDRLASKQDTSLADWLRRNQDYDSAQTLLGYTTTTRNVDRELYYGYLGLLDTLGNVLGAPTDLSTLPTAKQLGLPTQGIAGVALRANDQRIALQLSYEQSPLEGAVSGEGNLMTTAAVVGILAAVAVPAYQDYMIRSQVSEGAMLAEGAKMAIAQHYSSTGRMPKDNAEAGIAAPASISGKYASSVTIEDGRIFIAYEGAQANAALRGSVLVFAPHPTPDAVKWTCVTTDGTTINVKFRPMVCRP